MKIAIIGSRSINEKDFVFAELDYLFEDFEGMITIVSGGAKGLDSIAKQYATERGLEIIEHLPDYNKYSGKVAPLKRNHLIVEDADALIAFSKQESKGTAYTINLARKKGITVKVIEI